MDDHADLQDRQENDRTPSKLYDTLSALEDIMQQHLAALITRKNCLNAERQQREELTASQRLSSARPRTASARAASARNRRAAIAEAEKVPEPILELPKRHDKVVVKVKITFLKVGEIDTIHDRFAADAVIQAKWREPAFDRRHDLVKAPMTIDWDRYWTPKLFVENVYGDPKESTMRLVTIDADGLATVVERRRVNASFQEYMELNEFPFDMQDLTIVLTTERDEKELEFIADPKEMSSVNVTSFVDEQEWKLYKKVQSWSKVDDEAPKPGTNKHPTFSVACKASRRSGFFIYNVFIVMFMICSMSFCTFSVQSTFPQNRLQLSFILLLTNVSFKFVVNQSLPMISYLTILDKYILGSMGILCFVCAWHAMIAKMIFECQSAIVGGNTTYTTKVCAGVNAPITQTDSIVLAVLAVSYVLFHIVFSAVVYALFKEHEKYDTDEEGSENQAFDFDESGVIPDLWQLSGSLQRPDGNSGGGGYSDSDTSNQNALMASG